MKNTTYWQDILFAEYIEETTKLENAKKEIERIKNEFKQKFWQEIQEVYD